MERKSSIHSHEFSDITNQLFVLIILLRSKNRFKINPLSLDLNQDFNGFHNLSQDIFPIFNNLLERFIEQSGFLGCQSGHMLFKHRVDFISSFDFESFLMGFHFDIQGFPSLFNSSQSRFDLIFFSSDFTNFSDSFSILDQIKFENFSNRERFRIRFNDRSQ